MSSPASSVISNEESQTFEALQGTLIETAVSTFYVSRCTIYVYFFISAIHNLSQRKMAGRRPLLIATWLMLLLGTTQIVLQLADAAKLASLTRSSGIIQSAQEILFTGNNFFTDIVLVYRCYAIWGFQRKIVILPSGLMIVTLDTHSLLVSSQICRLPDLLVILVQTRQTAGRLCWIQRTSSSAAPIIQQRCAKAFEIIVESGAIYCLCAAVLAITRPRDSNDSDMPVLFVITVGISYQGVVSGGHVAHRFRPQAQLHSESDSYPGSGARNEEGARGEGCRSRSENLNYDQRSMPRPDTYTSCQKSLYGQICRRAGVPDASP
ncbi:hypothetical protein FB45DRAFT_934840, partial [Roridomyces roridus]